MWDKILKFKSDARVKTFKENASNLSERIGPELWVNLRVEINIFLYNIYIIFIIII